jgi:hypothetical protein
MKLAALIIAATLAGPPDETADTAPAATADQRAAILARELAIQAQEAARLAANDPVTVSIQGPRDAELGDQNTFTLDTTGVIEFTVWTATAFVLDQDGRPRLDTDVTGLVPMKGNQSAVFTNRQPGRYLIGVSVSGPKGLATDQWEFEILEPQFVEVPQQQPAQQPQQAPQQQPAAAMPAMPSPPVIQQGTPSPPPPGPHENPRTREEQRQAELERNVLAWIPTGRGRTNAELQADCQIVAGSLRSFASRAQRGQVAAGADFWAEAYAQARMALNGGSALWASFFDKFGRALLTLPPEKRNDYRIYNDVAGVLDRVRF